MCKQRDRNGKQGSQATRDSDVFKATVNVWEAAEMWHCADGKVFIAGEMAEGAVAMVMKPLFLQNPVKQSKWVG